TSRVPLSSLGVGALGLVAGISLWSAAAFGGDAFFHIGRIRKLVDFGSISLRSLDEFRDGGLHPGYAFPLWHGFMALTTKLAGAARRAGRRAARRRAGGRDRSGRRRRALAAADRAGDGSAQSGRRRASPRLRQLSKRARRLRAAPLPAQARALRPGWGRLRGR